MPDDGRVATIERRTFETDIRIFMDIDGSGNYNINTGIPFFNHLLELFSKQARFDIEIRAEGDIEVDFHHLVEDVGIVLGEALKKALGNKGGIRRYSSIYIPMDETLVRVCVDISGRGYLYYNVEMKNPMIVHFNAELVEDFIRGFAISAGITIHVDLIRGKNAHHIAEAIFKAFGVALREATEVIFPDKDVPSTKGVL